jgi:hypothetical protein
MGCLLTFPMTNFIKYTRIRAIALDPAGQNLFIAVNSSSSYYPATM